jgi:hypothetical protein
VCIDIRPSGATDSYRIHRGIYTSLRESDEKRSPGDGKQTVTDWDLATITIEHVLLIVITANPDAKLTAYAFQIISAKLR